MTMLRRVLRVVALTSMSLGLLGLFGTPSTVRAAADEVHVLEIDGIINPISSRYLVRGIRDGADEGAAAVLIEMNTPGGLVSSTEEITNAMLAAELPVIVYVTPAGARAASAGTFITMAGHVAAMAPSTRIGAATPVGTDGADIPEDLRAKIINDTVEYARIIAEERGRNADWVEDAVRDAVVVSADEAVELEVVDLLAPDRADLLASVDGRTVTLAGDSEVTLVTADAGIDERPMSPFEEFLSVLSDPNIALILLSLGSLGIYFELSAPGSFFPGIAGAIALILGLFSLGTLPINYAGLALIILGLALMGAEIWVASGGVLGIGGAISFVLGALLLIDDTQAPFLEISRPLIYGITLALVGFSLFAVRAVMRTRRRPVSIGGSDMVGMEAVVRGSASIYVEGELWRARMADGGEPLERGSRVRVIAREGFDLIVEPVEAVDAEAGGEATATKED